MAGWWDVIFFLMLAAALWWGSRSGFAASFFEAVAILGGAALGCVFYANLANFLGSSMGMKKADGKPDHSAYFWGFMIVFGGFWFLLSTQKHRFKRMVLRIPSALDTILGVALWGAFGLLTIGIIMMVVAWMSWADLQKWVLEDSYVGSRLSDHMPAVYYASRNPNAKRLSVEGSEINISDDQELQRKTGGFKTNSK